LTLLCVPTGPVMSSALLAPASIGHGRRPPEGSQPSSSDVKHDLGNNYNISRKSLSSIFPSSPQSDRLLIANRNSPHSHHIDTQFQLLGLWCRTT
jgi:hypothetical protein